MPSCQGRDTPDLRRSQQRPNQHGLRSDSAGSNHICGCARDPNRYRIKPEPGVLDIPTSGRGETIKPGGEHLAQADVRTIATPQIALEAAVKMAAQHGLASHTLGDAIEGEVRDVGKVLAGLRCKQCGGASLLPHRAFSCPAARRWSRSGDQDAAGSNVEFLLSLAATFDGYSGIHALAGDTDGVDGSEEITGADLAPDSIALAWAQGISVKRTLAENDGHGFFEALSDGIVNGPTLSNFNDFRAILITQKAARQAD